MMRSETDMRPCCKKSIRRGKVYERIKISLASNKNKILRLPIIRGVVNLVDMMGFGVKTLTKSAKMFDEQSSRL